MSNVLILLRLKHFLIHELTPESIVVKEQALQ